MGFSIENVWNIEARDLGNIQEEGSEERAETLKQYMNTLKGMDEVTAVGLISHIYTGMTMNGNIYQYKNRTELGPLYLLDDECSDVLDIDEQQYREGKLVSKYI